MKIVNKLRMFIIPIMGLVSMNTSFAYDDIYASTQKGGQVYAEKTQKDTEKRSQKKAQRKEIKERKDMVIIKSPNLERYDLVADEFVLVIDTTIKSTDDYMMDTIRIVNDNGDLEKTLMLKTKEKQNVYFSKGALIIESPSAVSNQSDSTLIAIGSDDYEYTQRLNKYHGTDYDVVTPTENEKENNVGNSTVYVENVWGYPYGYSWYGPSLGYSWYTWNYYDPFWGYYGYYRPYYYRPYYSYYYGWGYNYYGYYHPYHYSCYYPHYYSSYSGKYHSIGHTTTQGRRSDGVRSSSSERRVASTGRADTRSINRSSSTVTRSGNSTVTRSNGNVSRSSGTNTEIRRNSSGTNSSSSYNTGNSVRRSNNSSSSSRSSYSSGSTYRQNSSRGTSSNSYSGSSRSGSYSGSSRSGSYSGGSRSGYSGNSYSSGSSHSSGYSSGSSGGSRSSSGGGSRSGGGRR